MNKKKKFDDKRLALNKQTIRLLNEPQMAEVLGGLWTCGCTEGNCPPYTGQTCSCACY